MRKLAFRYRRIKDMYNTYRVDVQSKDKSFDSNLRNVFFIDLIGQQKYEELLQLRVDTENITGAWLTLALKALNIIKQR